MTVIAQDDHLTAGAWAACGQTAMANLKRPELKLGGNMSENFKNFELRFHDYCIQADYRNLAKNPETERADYYKKPLLEISALRSAMPDESLASDPLHN